MDTSSPFDNTYNTDPGQSQPAAKSAVRSSLPASRPQSASSASSNDNETVTSRRKGKGRNGRKRKSKKRRRHGHVRKSRKNKQQTSDSVSRNPKSIFSNLPTASQKMQVIIMIQCRFRTKWGYETFKIWKRRILLKKLLGLGQVSEIFRNPNRSVTVDCPLVLTVGGKEEYTFKQKMGLRRGSEALRNFLHSPLPIVL